MLGKWANTIEKGATVIGSDRFTFMGSKDGIIPEEFTFNICPFKSTVWLCKFPSLAVKWYSSLVYRLILEYRDI